MKVLPQEHLYHRVQLYSKMVREEGGALSARIAMAAGYGNKTKLEEFGNKPSIFNFGHDYLENEEQ